MTNRVPDYLTLLTDLIYEELLGPDGLINTDALEYVMHIQYNGVKIESFFSPASIFRTTTEVFSDEKNRDFILGLVQRLAVRLDESDVSALIDIITTSYKQYSMSPLIPPPIREVLVVDVDEIRSQLSQNFWLLTYYLVLLSKGNLNDIYNRNVKQTPSTKNG